jgi:cytochrome c
MSVTRTARLLALATVLIAPAAFAAGKAENGKALFVSKGCSACHGVTKDAAPTIGPNLVGVVGRKAGTTQGLMPPTAALVKHGVTWNAKSLDEFLENPMTKVPGTTMAGILPDAGERADVIAYLSSLKK